jgi:hypothetical protein
MTMKKLALLLLLAGSATALADDSSGNLLQNGDFSSGLSEWEGDCHTFDSSDADAPPDLSASPTTSANPAATQGVFVKLRHDDWTKMTQDFDGKAGQYLLTITYSFASDAKLSTSPDDYANIPASTGMSRFRAFSSTPGKWVVIICDLGAMHFYYWEIPPQAQPGATGPQTFTTQVRLASDDEEKKAVCLVFPPGEGLVTIKNVSLAPQPGQ